MNTIALLNNIKMQSTIQKWDVQSTPLSINICKALFHFQTSPVIVEHHTVNSPIKYIFTFQLKMEQSVICIYVIFLAPYFI